MCGLGRQLMFGFLLTLLIGVAAVAQLPPPTPLPSEPTSSKDPPSKPVPIPSSPADAREQLKANLSAILGDRSGGLDDGAATERAMLQMKLMELIKRIDARTSGTPIPNPNIAPKPTPVSPTLEGKSIDPIRRGINLFRDNDFGGAQFVFTQIDPNLLSREEIAFSQYMKACCLRRLNKPYEAAIVYRELADAHEDDFITECAIWQLAMINAAKELEGQLEQLRSRTKSR